MIYCRNHVFYTIVTIPVVAWWLPQLGAIVCEATTPFQQARRIFVQMITKLDFARDIYI